MKSKVLIAKLESESPWGPAWTHQIKVVMTKPVDIMRGQKSWELAARSIKDEAALCGAKFLLPIEVDTYWRGPNDEEWIPCNGTLVIDPDGCGAIRVATPEYEYVRTGHMFVTELFDLFL